MSTSSALRLRLALAVSEGIGEDKVCGVAHYLMQWRRPQRGRKMASEFDEENAIGIGGSGNSSGASCRACEGHRRGLLSTVL